MTVIKTAPQVTSVSPRNNIDLRKPLVLLVISDGGESIEMSLFWGSSDGGTNANVDSVDPNLWDHLCEFKWNLPDGLVSHYIDGLE